MKTEHNSGPICHSFGSQVFIRCSLTVVPVPPSAHNPLVGVVRFLLDSLSCQQRETPHSLKSSQLQTPGTVPQPEEGDGCSGKECGLSPLYSLFLHIYSQFQTALMHLESPIPWKQWYAPTNQRPDNLTHHWGLWGRLSAHSEDSHTHSVVWP